MRKKIVVGNWKMNKTVEEAVELSTAVAEQLGDCLLYTSPSPRDS